MAEGKSKSMLMRVSDMPSGVDARYEWDTRIQLVLLADPSSLLVWAMRAVLSFVVCMPSFYFALHTIYPPPPLFLLFFLGPFMPIERCTSICRTIRSSLGDPRISRCMNALTTA
jgi:hypothetical protein